MNSDFFRPKLRSWLKLLITIFSWLVVNSVSIAFCLRVWQLETTGVREQHAVCLLSFSCVLLGCLFLNHILLRSVFAPVVSSIPIVVYWTAINVQLASIALFCLLLAAITYSKVIKNVGSLDWSGYAKLRIAILFAMGFGVCYLAPFHADRQINYVMCAIAGFVAATFSAPALSDNFVAANKANGEGSKKDK